MLDENYVVAFDLDDTLYSELDYQKSGYIHLAKLVNRLYKVEIPSLYQIIGQGGDVIGGICNLLGDASLRDSLLWEYRNHFPKIKLCDGMESLLNCIEKFGAKIIIITDGRSLSQRLKLEALQLQKFECFVSDEYASEKPDLLRFQLVERMYPRKKYIYIGDNISKDFAAPNKLNWRTILFKPSWKLVHKQPDFIHAENFPGFYADGVLKLESILNNIK